MTTETAALTSSQRSWRARILVSTWLAYAGFYFCRKAFYVVKKPLGEALARDRPETTQARG